MWYLKMTIMLKAALCSTGFDIILKENDIRNITATLRGRYLSIEYLGDGI
jgi:hypothetical protein